MTKELSCRTLFHEIWHWPGTLRWMDPLPLSHRYFADRVDGADSVAVACATVRSATSFSGSGHQ
ncbi:hypothetical protein ACGVWS_03165 [Enterobacteriaceae bacterium LUAb1]